MMTFHDGAPPPVSPKRRRQQLEATIRTGEQNAAEWTEAGRHEAAAKCLANLERFRAELAELK